MRPVNLIPPEDRRGDRAPARAGVAAYVVVALLAVALGAVTLVVLTSNTIADRKSQISTLQAQEASARAQAQRLSSFAEFANLQETREETVSTLARSRFDWERVMRELAIVIPDDVWLTSITAKVSPQAQLGENSGGSGSSGSESSLTDSIESPSLDLIGCGSSHEAVARFAAALEDIDGVTRVGVAKSDLPEQTQAGGTGTSGGTDCRTRDFISQFEIAVAFDAVPVDATTGLPTAPAPPSDDGGVSGAQAEEQQARDAIQSQTDEAHDVVTVIPGVVR